MEIENYQQITQVEVAMVKDLQVWKETEDWLRQVKVHSERFRTKLSIQVSYKVEKVKLANTPFR